jgi:hypothetical protein
MNYEDQLKDLLERIRREQEEEHDLPKQAPPIFDDPNDLVSFLRNRPVISTVEVTTLSSFLRRFRRGLGIKIDDVTNALGLEPQDLENLESIDYLPWKVSPQSIAIILSSYRIHVSALKFLIQNSFEIARVSGRISTPIDTEQVISTWLSDVASTLRTVGEQSLLS